MTRLGEVQQKRAPASTSSRLAAALSGHQHLEDVVVPIHGAAVAAKMRLVGAAHALDIEGDVSKAMERRGLQRTAATYSEFELERTIRLLAEAVRDPEDVAKPFGTIEEWGRLPVDVLAEMRRQYDELSERLDPASSSRELSDVEIAEIRLALKKKDRTSLRYFGARQLASYLLISDAQPASSPTPTSSDGVSSQES